MKSFSKQIRLESIRFIIVEYTLSYSVTKPKLAQTYIFVKIQYMSSTFSSVLFCTLPTSPIPPPFSGRWHWFWKSEKETHWVSKNQWKKYEDEMLYNHNFTFRSSGYIVYNYKSSDIFLCAIKKSSPLISSFLV